MSDRLERIMASSKPLITFLMDDEQLQRLDDFRFAFRYGSRGAAIRHLIDVGLAAELERDRPAREQKAARRKQSAARAIQPDG